MGPMFGLGNNKVLTFTYSCQEENVNNSSY